MFVLSSNSRTVSFVAGYNDGFAADTSDMETAESVKNKDGMLNNDTIRSLEAIVKQQKIKLDEYK